MSDTYAPHKFHLEFLLTMSSVRPSINTSEHQNLTDLILNVVQILTYVQSKNPALESKHSHTLCAGTKRMLEDVRKEFFLLELTWIECSGGEGVKFLHVSWKRVPRIPLISQLAEGEMWSKIKFEKKITAKDHYFMSWRLAVYHEENFLARYS